MQSDTKRADQQLRYFTLHILYSSSIKGKNPAVNQWAGCKWWSKAFVLNDPPPTLYTSGTSLNPVAQMVTHFLVTSQLKHLAGLPSWKHGDVQPANFSALFRLPGNAPIGKNIKTLSDVFTQCISALFCFDDDKDDDDDQVHDSQYLMQIARKPVSYQDFRYLWQTMFLLLHVLNWWFIPWQSCCFLKAFSHNVGKIY